MVIGRACKAGGIVAQVLGYSSINMHQSIYETGQQNDGGGSGDGGGLMNLLDCDGLIPAWPET